MHIQLNIITELDCYCSCCYYCCCFLIFFDTFTNYLKKRYILFPSSFLLTDSHHHKLFSGSSAFSNRLSTLVCRILMILSRKYGLGVEFIYSRTFSTLCYNYYVHYYAVIFCFQMIYPSLRVFF